MWQGLETHAQFTAGAFQAELYPFPVRCGGAVPYAR